MKVLKPSQLGLLTKVYEHGGDCVFVATVMMYVPFEAPARLLSEIAMWRFIPEAFGAEAPFDECMPKARGEVLVTASACAPEATPRAAVRTRVSVRNVDKTLLAVGDRRWSHDAMTSPEPFARMPLNWARAFGGPRFAANPLGRGHGAEDGDPLPNVEDPRRAVRTRDDAPEPAGYGPVDLTWPQRARKVGTYDAAWLATRYPGLADDLDWSYFNVAPPDQWLDGYFAGDETLRFEGMHPRQPTQSLTLPGLVARVFVVRDGAHGEEVVEVPTRIDTVHAFPTEERAVIVHRGIVRVASDDAAELTRILVAAEQGGAPKPVQHYLDVMAARLDRHTGHLAALRDGDLTPPKPDVALTPRPEEVNDMEALTRPPGLLARNLRERARRERQRGRDELQRLGLDPAAFYPPGDQGLPEAPSPPSPDELAELVPKLLADAEALRAEAEAQRVDGEARARAAYAEAGMDYDVLRAQAEREAGGPPKFRAEAECARLRALTAAANGGEVPPEVEALLTDPTMRETMALREQSELNLYRAMAHVLPPAAPMDPDRAAQVRALVAAAHADGRGLAGLDLTGADLSAMDLRGAVFEGSFLEGVRFDGAQLEGARFDGAVVARAVFHGARLAGASFANANAGAARFDGADCTRALFLHTVLEKSELAGGRFVECDFEGARFYGTSLAGADLTGAKLRGLSLLDAELPGARFAGADLTECTFLNVTLDDADLTGARLDEATFLGVRADRAHFREAHARNLRAVGGGSFVGANFVDAVLDDASMRAVVLRDADLSRASLRGADLSGANLTGARLFRARAERSRWVRADLSHAVMLSINLMDAILQKARIEGADLRGANLHRADMARIEGGTHRTDGALLTLTRTLPRRTDEPV